MDTAEAERHQRQRRRLYLEDRIEELDGEIVRFRDELTRLKELIASKPTGETLTHAQRRLNYVRERFALLRAERNAAAAERNQLIQQLREEAAAKPT